MEIMQSGEELQESLLPSRYFVRIRPESSCRITRPGVSSEQEPDAGEADEGESGSNGIRINVR